MTGSPLLSIIEASHGAVPYGRVLDAGTGPKSLSWLMTVNTDSCTAVTGSLAMKAQVELALGEWQRPLDRMIIGNWADPNLLAGEQFDTVLADHLLGAIEGFAPFFQTELFARLRPLTLKRLYVTGMEPYVIERPGNSSKAVISEIGRYHDACLLLSGRRPFREYPLKWVLAQLRLSGFQPVAARKIPVGYKADFVNSQIDRCRPHLKRLTSQTVALSLISYGEALRSRALAHIDKHGPVAHQHYAIAADPV